MPRRVEIKLSFSADLDGVPGWGHQPQDWVDLINHELSRNAHYHPEIIVHSVAVKGPERSNGADDLQHLDGMLDDRERG